MNSQIERIPIQAVLTFLSAGDRAIQEDHALVDQERGIFAVADGFGGPLAGSQASVGACDAVRKFLFKEAGDLDATMPFVLRKYFSLAGNVLFNSMIYANLTLNQLNKSKSINERGGASAIAAYMDGDLLAVANVGTCSGWIFRAGQMVEMVMPRSFHYLCDPFSVHAGEQHQGLQHEFQKVPLIALGMTEDLEPEIFEYRLKKKDWILLATDGMSMEAKKGLLEIHKNTNKLENALQEVKNLLNKLTYKDNISISLAIL